MDDLRENIRGERSFLEKIGRIIPGYSGYKEKLMRQEADKLLRDYLVQQINVQMGYMKDLIDEMTRAMKIKNLDLVDRPLKKLEKVRDRIRFASHGYTGWFSATKVDTSVLDKMYEFDNALLDDVGIVAEKVQAARNSVDDDAALVAALQELHRIIDETDVQYNERDNFVLQQK